MQTHHPAHSEWALPASQEAPVWLLTADELLDWCLWQVIDTTYGQSSGSMVTPAAWAQVTWKEVGHRPHEHWIQAPACRFPAQRLRQ